MIKIDKGIPVPERKSPGRKPTYPWREMEIGDSFYVDRAPHMISGRITEAGRRHGRKFTVREEGDGARVWRIE